MMHRLVVVVTLCVGMIRGGSAQAPITLDGLHALLVDAALTTARIDSISGRVLDVSTRGKVLAADFAKHNAEPCEYPEGHPELCANFDRERQDLNLRLNDLKKEWAGYDADLKPLRLHFATLMTLLRNAGYAGEMKSWKAPMIFCSNVNGVAEAAKCLTNAVARHPLSMTGGSLR